MPSNYYHQVVDAIREQGFTRIRQGKGSHEIWARAGAAPKGLDTQETTESAHCQPDTEGRRLRPKGLILQVGTMYRGTSPKA